MKHVFSPLSLAAAIALACAGSALAADGTITITGQITDMTCNIAVDGGSNDAAVTLPVALMSARTEQGDARLDLDQAQPFPYGATGA